MPDTIKFAIVGCGRIAGRHAVHIKTYGRLLAVCDIVKEKADELAHQYDVLAYYDLETLLREQREVDVVAVCTPNGLHAEHSISILNAGRHVLCEKPMAINTVDCKRMIAASKRTGKILFVVKQNRFNPPIEAVKKLLDAGVLGRVYSIQLNCFWNRDPDYYHNSWKGSIDLDGGTLFTQFSHFIDLLYWMVGDVKDLKAIINNYGHKGIIEFEDTGVAILEFENGAIGTLNYTVNSHNQNMEGSITLFCEKGTVKVGGQYLNRIDYQNIEGYTIENLPEGNGANQYGTYQGSMSNHGKVYENLVKYFKQSEPFYVSPLEGLKTVAIIERIYQSAYSLTKPLPKINKMV
jgi:predicted dehydrogenase